MSSNEYQYAFEEQLSESFTSLTGDVEDILKQVLKDKLNVNCNWIDVENQETVNVIINQPNGEQSNDEIIIHSSAQADGSVVLKLKSPTHLFEGKVLIPLNLEQSQTFRSMMLIAETYDCYLALRGNSPKELNSNYKTWGDKIKQS